MENPNTLKKLQSIADESFRKSAEFLNEREDVNEEIMKNWRLLLTDSEINSCVEHCARVIQDKFRGKKIVIVCILKGAVYFLVDLTRKLTIPHSIYGVECSSYKGQHQHGIEILSLIQPEKFQDKDAVVIVDELVDNGTTMESVEHLIIKDGGVPPEKIFKVALFNKDNDCQYKGLDLCGITLGNLWLVGYGLDNLTFLRNWTHLYGCPKAEGIQKSTADKIFEDPIYYAQEREKLINICNRYEQDTIKRNSLKGKYSIKY